MKVRLYSIERRAGVNLLVSYQNDLIDAFDVPRELVALASRKRAYVLYTLESDPEFGRELRTPFTRARQREHALRLWAKGKVLDVQEKRPAVYPI